MPERLTERCCSFGVRDWQSRSSPAHGRCVVESTGRWVGLPGQETETSAGLAVAVLTAGGQFVLRRGDRLAAVGAFAGEVGDCAGQFAHRAGHGDAEYALAALEEVDDLFGRRALVDGGAVGEQRDVGQVADAALAQVVDRDADVCLLYTSDAADE